jgi:DNA repair exonuclease SbcCD ATPase subunit
MKNTLVLILIFSSLLAGALPNGQEGEKIVAAIEANVCATDSDKDNSKTEAEGICLDCIYGTQSTPQWPKGLSPIKFAELKLKRDQENVNFELEFWKLAEEKGLLNSYSSTNSPESLKIQIKAYEEQSKNYATLKSYYEEIVSDPEAFKAKLKSLGAGEKPSGGIKKRLNQVLAYYNPGEGLGKQIDDYKKALAQAKMSAKSSEGGASETLLVSNVKAYEDAIAQLSESLNTYQEVKDWMNNGGLPVPQKIKEVLVSFENEASTAKTSLQQFDQNLTTYKNAISQLEQKLSELESKNKTVTDADSTEEATSESQKKIAENQKKAKAQVLDAATVRGFKRCGMTDAEILALRWYTGSHYSWINRALRAGGEEAKKIAPMKEMLNRALKKLAPYKGEVGRGATLPQAVFDEHKPGAIVNYSAFTSTAIGTGFGSAHKFIIKSKTGRYIGSHSSVYSEREVLFAADTKFKVLEVKGNEVTMEEVQE